jgi:DUF971 family protein
MTTYDPKATTPTMVRAPVGATVTEVDWVDGHTSVLPNALLRGYCPCAGCQGHSGEIKFVPGNNAEITALEEVGAYALQFTWGDGHGSGIYSFRYLRRLGELAAEDAAARPAIPRGAT